MSTTHLSVREARAQILRTACARTGRGVLSHREITTLPTIDGWNTDILEQAITDLVRRKHLEPVGDLYILKAAS